MARRKERATHRSFEGSNPRGAFTKITHDMMDSQAWKSLSLRQRGLYLEMKAKYREKKVSGELESSNVDDITLPESEWKELYGTYRTFKTDLDALIEKGFLRIVQPGKNIRKPNIYGFAASWKEWRA